MPKQGSGFFEWQHDTAPAAWLADRLNPWNQDTGSIVPAGFEAFVRLFHPAREADDKTPLRWSEVARRNGRRVHPGMQFAAINRPRPGMPAAPQAAREPSTGSLPVRERVSLLDVLAEETESPERCWFCMWEGWGGLDDQGVTARVRLPNRNYLLYAGPLGLALAPPPESLSKPGIARSVGVLPRVLSPLREVLAGPVDAPDGPGIEPQSPAIWWPDDRSWIIVTEIAFSWTYVGGSRRLCERLLAHPALEVLPAAREDNPRVDGDALNADAAP
jgi:hypothetical protein